MVLKPSTKVPSTSLPQRRLADLIPFKARLALQRYPFLLNPRGGSRTRSRGTRSRGARRTRSRGTRSRGTAPLDTTACCALCKAEPQCGIWVITPFGNAGSKCWLKTS